MMQYVIAILLLILIYGGYRMADALADLTTAVGNLEAATTAVVNKINQLKSTPGVDPTQVETLVARVNTVASNLTAASQ